MVPSGATMTPEPSERCTRSVGTAKGELPPKKRRKNGSLRKGEAAVRTVRREKTLTTAGAVFFTTGAKESWISVRLCGATRVCASAGAARRKVRMRKRERKSMDAFYASLSPCGRGPG